MTPVEFKAWFDGFTEAFEGKIPTKVQWSRIKERVAEIDGKSVTERVYVDRYIHQYLPQWISTPYSSYYISAAQAASSNIGTTSGWRNTQNNLYCSTTAMNALGRAEAASLS